MNVAIYIYENAEVLDFSGPYEVFATASRLSHSKRYFNVFMVAENKQPVVARAGYSVNPQYSFADHPKIDVLIVSGGIHNKEMQKIEVIEWLVKVAEEASTVASVCTGAFLLAQAGLLNNLEVTTHWEDIGDLRQSFGKLHVVESRRWVDQGKFVTSGGISAGIDMSLHLVSKLAGFELADQTARQMEFDWQKQ